MNQTEMEPLGLLDEYTAAVHIGIDPAASGDFTGICLCAVTRRIFKDGATADLPERWRHALVAPGVGTLAQATRASRNRVTLYRIPVIGRWPHGMHAKAFAANGMDLLLQALEFVSAEKLRRDEAGMPVYHVPVACYMDRTGMGGALFDLFRQTAKEDPRTKGCRVYGLNFVAGEKYDRSRGVVGKTHLVSRLQTLLSLGQLEIHPDNEQLDILLSEIKAYHYQISEAGHITWGGVGEHDDLVTALALACVDDPDSYMAKVGARMFPGPSNS